MNEAFNKIFSGIGSTATRLWKDASISSSVARMGVGAGVGAATGAAAAGRDHRTSGAVVGGLTGGIGGALFSSYRNIPPGGSGGVIKGLGAGFKGMSNDIWSKMSGLGKTAVADAPTSTGRGFVGRSGTRNWPQSTSSSKYGTIIGGGASKRSRGVVSPGYSSPYSSPKPSMISRLFGTNPVDRLFS